MNRSTDPVAASRRDLSSSFKWEASNGNGATADVQLQWQDGYWKLMASAGNSNARDFKQFQWEFATLSEDEVFHGQRGTLDTDYPLRNYKYSWNQADQYGDITLRSMYLQGIVYADIEWQKGIFSGTFEYLANDPGTSFEGRGQFSIRRV
jgi:hypothetical protein